MRKRPVMAWASTLLAISLPIGGLRTGFPDVKSVGSHGAAKGDTIGLSNSSKQAFVSSDSVIVGSTCRWLAMYSWEKFRIHLNYAHANDERFYLQSPHYRSQSWNLFDLYGS